MSDVIASWLKRENPTQPLPTWSCLCNAIANVDLTTAERIAVDKELQIIPTGRMYM